MAVAEPLVFAAPSARPTNNFGDYHASIVAHSHKKCNSLQIFGNMSNSIHRLEKGCIPFPIIVQTTRKWLDRLTGR